ncbi:MAG: glycerophosphodiester phosphodiesterase [Acidobacteriota bacterium]|nr:glycerophosphodiester phosphodiesterase [Acidobacteriota bacterium]
MTPRRNWLERRVIAYAHQGGSFEGPSSTLFAIEEALAHGATAIELDVHATRDRHIVVCHDETVDRTTNHAGAIADLTLAQLREMDNAYWWIEGDAVTPGRAPEEYPHRAKAPGDRRFGVATLEEVAVAFPAVLMNLDIKRGAPVVEPYEQLLVDELVRLELVDRVMVASFLDDAIASFRALASDVATSAATQETATFFFSLREGTAVVPPVQAFQVPASFGDITVVDELFVTAAHDAGVAVHVWTINDPAEMARLVDLGVDAVITDRPSVLSRLLEERGVAWDGTL